MGWGGGCGAGGLNKLYSHWVLKDLGLGLNEGSSQTETVLRLEGPTPRAALPPTEAISPCLPKHKALLQPKRPCHKFWNTL